MESTTLTLLLPIVILSLELSVQGEAVALGEVKIGQILPNLRIRQEAVNLNPASLQTQEREAVVMPLPISMHTGQIIMLTKMFTAADLRFYEFEDDVPVHRWHSAPSSPA
jgi:hypothetical protein